MSARDTVTWASELQESLAARWLASPPEERRRLTTIGNRIDKSLKRSPGEHGMEVWNRPGYRIWRIPDVVPPVLVVFEVLPEDRIVDVLQILLFSS